MHWASETMEGRAMGGDSGPGYDTVPHKGAKALHGTRAGHGVGGHVGGIRRKVFVPPSPPWGYRLEKKRYCTC